MLGILLTILKIIGIVILCILGFLLGILLIVFLVPIRYEAQGEIYEEYHIKMKVHWLLHLLHVVVQLKGKVIEVSVRIFGKKVFSLGQEQQEEEQTKETQEKTTEEVKEKNKEEDRTSEKEATVEETNTTSEKEATVEEANTTSKKETEMILEEETISDKQEIESVESNEEKKVTTQEKQVADDRTFSEKLEDKLYEIFDTIADKCENLEKTIEDLQDKIEQIKKTVYHYLDLISHERTQNLLRRLFQEIRGVFVHIAPQKLKVNLHIGMDNPATTGQICMYAAMLYPIYKDNIQLEPDFEEKVLEGTFSLKGRIRLGHFVAMVVRLVVNKDFWYVITHIKPKDEKKTNQITKQN